MKMNVSKKLNVKVGSEENKSYDIIVESNFDKLSGLLSELFLSCNKLMLVFDSNTEKFFKGRLVQELKNIRLKLLTLVAPHKPIAPMVEPVQLITKWLYPAKGKHKNGDYKTTKPDTDNMIKLLKDCMTLVGYWKDDAYVVSEITEKFYADTPGIYICVRSLSNDNS